MMGTSGNIHEPQLVQTGPQGFDSTHHTVRWMARMAEIFPEIGGICGRSHLSLQITCPGVCNHMSVLVPGTTERFLVAPFGVLWSLDANFELAWVV